MTLPLVLLLALLGHTTFVVVVFVLHYYDSATRERPVPSGRAYLHAARREWWYELLSLLVFPLGWLPPLSPWRFEAGGGPPIVLLHGYARNRGSMLALYWRLRRAGYRNVYNLGLGRTRDPIEMQGERVLAELTTIADLTEGRALIAVAHSMGGLVARFVIERGAPIALLITLGTPHHGTRTAYLGLGASPIEMRPGSTFLAGLDDPPAVPVRAFYTDLDNIIVPFESAALGDDAKLFPGRGHMTLAFDAEIFDAVCEVLDRYAAPAANAG